MAWAKPTSITLTGTCNYTNGGDLQVRGARNYYVYFGGSWSGYKYYKKGQIGSSGYLNTFIDDDPDISTSFKEFQVVLSSTDIGDGVNLSGNAGDYVYYLRVPRWACYVYKGMNTFVLIDSYNNSELDYEMERPSHIYGTWNYEGLSYSRTSYSPSYTRTTWSASLNEGTWYGVYTQPQSSSRSTCYYYRGTSSRKSVTITTTTAERTLYGTGQTRGGSTSTSMGNMTTSCLADSTAVLQGWATSSSSTSVRYTSASDAFDAGYSTIYGVYKKSGSESTQTYYYYRGDSSRRSVLKTTTISDTYYYGMGSKSGGTPSSSYGSMTTTCASDSSYTLIGWATTSNTTTTSYSSAKSAFDAGHTTIYGVYRKNGSSSSSTVYYYRGTSTRNSVTKTTSVTDAYYYGTGAHTGGNSISSYGTVNTECAVSGWDYIGFSASASESSSDATATSLWDAGHTTVYGTYQKTERMTYHPQNGSSSGSQNVTNYRYGTGSVTSNRPQEPSLSYEGYTFQGWGTSSTDTTPETWNTLWDAGTRTVYAIWLADYVYNVYFGAGDSWKQCKVYYGNNNQWVEASVYCGTGGTWKQ